MKELTIEEKAKAYDKAIEKFDVILNLNTVKESGTIFADDVIKIFPELKESEDEKIRKKLLSSFKGIMTDADEDELWYGLPYNDIIAWLEKQGEQNLVNETDEEIVEAVKDTSVLDLVEPKFKVGNWYQCTKDFFGKGVTFDKNTAYYCAKEGCLQCEYGCHIAIVKDLYDNFKLWTIQDAKEGDMLASDNGIIILVKESRDSSWGYRLSYHCAVLYDGTFEHRDFHVNSEKFFPATKEQRETLLKAMADAGYTFDFEKKELKKIEAKPDMIQWRGDNLKEIIEFTGKDKNFDKWFKSFAEYEKYISEHDNVFKLFNADGSHFEVPVGAWIVKTPDGYNVASKAIFKNNPAEWSEEDEMIALSIEQVMNCASLLNIVPEKIDKIRTWLKSLKDRYTWKPSDEQIEVLAWCKPLFADPKSKGILESLIEDLKKLMKK